MVSKVDRKERKKRPRRSFTDEFKAGAVALVLDEGKTVAQVARDLDLTVSALRGWVEQARADRTKGQTGLTTEEREELTRLRRENRELKMEREILKKAAVRSSGRCNSPDVCGQREASCGGSIRTETATNSGDDGSVVIGLRTSRERSAGRRARYTLTFSRTAASRQPLALVLTAH